MNTKTNISIAGPSGRLPELARRVRAARPAIAPMWLIVIANLWFLALFNAAFWSRTADLFTAKPVTFALFAVGIWALTMVYLLVFTNRWLLKPFLIANLFIGAAASYFHDTIGVVVDREMIQNTIGTTTAEARHLFTAGFLGWMFLTALLPALALLFVRPAHPRFARAALRHGGMLLGCGALFLGITFGNYQDLSFTLKRDSGVKKVLHPASPVWSVLQYGEMMLKAQSLEFTRIALDARKGAAAMGATRPVLTILVIGETLRDQNWGLSGYVRDTTPELAQRDIVAIAGVTACGTSTSVSIPCMFSKFTRKEYTYEKGTSHENLLDVLARAGYDVEWWDVNTGDMGVAERMTFTSFYGADDPEFCGAGECTDAILLDALKKKAGTIDRDTIIVMHQIGNHGPAYYLRYPRSFARFLPDCSDADLGKCATGEIVNAYDNAAAFTDLQLARTIDFLATLGDLNTALVFVSDHGESLGEKGLFLHAAPYWTAPAEQTKVPMLLWLSQNFRRDLDLDYGCLRDAARDPVSHDNFFHTVLGMHDVVTRERDEELNLFASCRNARPGGVRS